MDLNPYGLPWILASFFALSVAALIFLARPDRPQNRWLSLIIILESLTGIWVGLSYSVDAPTEILALARATFVVQATFFGAYLLFLSTIESPLARPLRHPASQAALAGLLVLAPILTFASRDDLVAGVDPGVDAMFRHVVHFGPAIATWGAALTPLYIFALVVSVTAIRAAPVGSVARAKAKAYFAAFVVYDAFFIGLNSLMTDLIVTPERVYVFYFLVTPLVIVAWVALIGRGILKTQLFDIDLKIKRGVKASTMGAAFVAVFFVVSEAAATVLTDVTGSTLAGIAAAGLLVFALAPLQRAAERVADVAMPTVAPSSEYLAFRKLEVYRAAVESALEVGGIDEKERAMLERQRAKLGIQPADAAAVERDVRARYGEAAAPVVA